MKFILQNAYLIALGLSGALTSAGGMSQAFGRTVCSPADGRVCLDTALPMVCGAPEGQSILVQQPDDRWILSVRGRPMTSAVCTELEFRVNCIYGSLFIQVGLQSVTESNEGLVTLFGSEGGAIFGIPYAQSVTCQSQRR